MARKMNPVKQHWQLMHDDKALVLCNESWHNMEQTKNDARIYKNKLVTYCNIFFTVSMFETLKMSEDF